MNNTAPWLSPLCLVMIVFATLITEWTGYQLPAVLAASVLLIFTFREWKGLELTAKITSFVALGLMLFLLVTAQITLLQLSELSSSVVFFTFFLIALSLLKEAAQTSKSVALTGLALLQQQPTKRYALLTFASHLFGILMSMGAINLLGTMINRSLEKDKHLIDQRINSVRQKRMMLAVLRGFCSIPLWAPTSVTITLLVTTIPQLQWIDIIPYGLYLAIALLSFGIGLDHIQAPRYLNHLAPRISNNLADFKVGYPITIVVSALAGMSGLLMSNSPLRPISAVLVAAIIVSILWIYAQYLQQQNKVVALKFTVTRFSTEIFYQLPAQRSEIVFFAASILIGRLLLTVLDLDLIAQQIAVLNLSAAVILILSSWLIFIAAMLYINPMITVTLMAGALAQLPILADMPVTIALVMMVTWAVVIGSCPSATSVRISAKIADIWPTHMGIKWNGLYSGIVLVVLNMGILLWV